MLGTLLTRGRVLAGVAGVALAGLLVAGVALAETPTPTPTNPANTAFQTFVHTLAQKLGKSDSDVQTAITQTQQDMIDQAVKDGKLTQAAADQLKARLQNGPLPFQAVPYGRGMARARAAVAFVGQEAQAAATFLGLTPAQLRTQLQSGKSLADVAQAQGKSRDDLKNALITSAQTRLNQAVANGRITQQQADTALNQFKANVDKLIDAKHTATNRQGRPFRGQPGKQGTPAPTPSPAPTGTSSS